MPYTFNFPLITEMTDAQQAVLDEPEAVAVCGGPGTGKSVVSLWRHIRNHDIGTRNSLLITYTKTLTVYLKNCARAQNAKAGLAVMRSLPYLNSYKPEHYDEIIIDEAQDINSVNYTTLKGLTKMVSYGADNQQILYPSRSTTEEQLLQLFPNNKEHELDENFRNSYEIMRFTQAAFPNRRFSAVMMELLRKERLTNNKPKFVIGDTPEKKIKAILEIINDFKGDSHNIGILLPLQQDVDNLYNFLKDSKVNCTRYFHDGTEIDEIENIHVTTFKSAKGIEFDTVILPDFDRWKANIAKLFVVEENDYYVAFTRAKRNLFLISNTAHVGIDPSTFEIRKV